jgi:hypothetical protein
MVNDLTETVTTFEAKYGEKIAGWAIVAIVAYLVIAQ